MKWTRDQKLTMGLIVAVFALCFTIFITTGGSEKLVEASSNYAVEVGSLRAEVKHLGKQVELLTIQLEVRTHPETIDASQRAWFEELLKNNPPQVRGIDGKLPKERK